MNQAQQVCSFDTETHRFGPRLVAPKVVCVSMAMQGSEPHLLKAKDAEIPLCVMLENAADGRTIAVGQNVAYDMACLLEHHTLALAAPIWRAYDALAIRCTRVQERLLDIAKGSRWQEREDGTFERRTYSLDVLAKKRLNLELDKATSWRVRFNELEDLPIEDWPEEPKNYATTDAVATLGVHLSQEEERRHVFPQYESWHEEAGRQAAFAFALQLVKARGMEIDKEAVAALGAVLTPKLEDARGRMLACGLLDPKKGSKKMAAIMEAVEKAWAGDGPVPRTPKGKVSTAADTVAQCLGDPGLEAFTEYAQVEKLLSSFVGKLADNKDGIVHPDYEVLGADTGRTSCRDPNMQQLPRAPGVRECFKAREGFVFISCDYDSQELRTLAQALQLILGKSVLAERYRQDPDFDPHTDFAAHLLGISYDEGMRRKKGKDPELLARRQQSKAANFGYPGGMGAEKFRLFAKGYDLRLTLDESTELKEGWLRQWPEMRDYFNVVGNRIDSGLTTFTQLQSGRLRGNVHFTNGCNTYFQGLAADASKNALWRVTKACFGAPGHEGSALYGCRVVAFVHDELLVEAPELYAHEAALELDRVMCSAMEELTPDVPARTSPALMRRWSKKSDLAYGDREHGDASRMICWEDYLARQRGRA